jgi:hypothetical protein
MAVILSRHDSERRSPVSVLTGWPVSARWSLITLILSIRVHQRPERPRCVRRARLSRRADFLPTTDRCGLNSRHGYSCNKLNILGLHSPNQCPERHLPDISCRGQLLSLNHNRRFSDPFEGRWLTRCRTLSSIRHVPAAIEHGSLPGCRKIGTFC